MEIKKIESKKKSNSPKKPLIIAKTTHIKSGKQNNKVSDWTVNNAFNEIYKFFHITIC